MSRTSESRNWPERRNWIGGAWREAISGIGFEVRDASGGRALGRFPRSAAADLELAIEAATGARDTWSAVPRSERARLVDRVRNAIEVEARSSVVEWVEQRLGLTADEYERCEIELGASRSRDHARSQRDSNGPPLVVLVASDWSELLRRPLERALAALASGCPIVIRADRDLAGAWGAVARAIESVDLPPGSVSLLHEDADVCSTAAIRDPRIGRVMISGAGSRLRWAAGIADASANGANERLDTELLCNRSHVVDTAADVDLEARFVADGSFGRAPALSGQAPGAIGRAICPERSFSRFTRALLEILDHDPALDHPLAIIDARAKRHLARAQQLGIDEGATLILAERDGAAPDLAAEAPSHGSLGGSEAPRAASRVSRVEGILRPVVFTNVEEHMRVAWLGRPAPVLCLMRVASEEHARALARDIDLESGPEDLSA